MLSVGKGSQIIQVLPTALKFWEKLGLEPRGGKKDVVAFVFYEDEDEGTQEMEDGETRLSETQAMAERWLAWMGTAYAVSSYHALSGASNRLVVLTFMMVQAKNMGSHTAGSAKTCVKDGLVSVKFETFRRSLGGFCCPSSLYDLD